MRGGITDQQGNAFEAERVGETKTNGLLVFRFFFPLTGFRLSHTFRVSRIGSTSSFLKPNSRSRLF